MIMGKSSAVGNNASSTNAVPVYNAAIQGSALFTLLYPDPENAARIVSANVGMANVSTFETITDGSYSFVNEPFKYTLGDNNPAGHVRWLNRYSFDESGEMLYMLANAATLGDMSDELPALPKAPDPAQIAAAIDSNDFAALTDTGAMGVGLWSKVRGNE